MLLLHLLLHVQYLKCLLQVTPPMLHVFIMFVAGFTFSFPMVQSSLNSALLLKWTKKFKCSGVEMEDVVEMLEAAFQRRSVSIRIALLIDFLVEQAAPVTV